MHIDRIESGVTRSLKVVCGIFMHISMLGVVLNIFGRVSNLFFISEWQFEALIYIMVAAAYLAIGPTLAEGGHVRADILVSKLKGKKQVAVELLVEIIGIGVAVICFVSAMTEWRFSITHDDMTPSGLLPRWPPLLIMAIGLLLYVSYGLLRTRRHISDLRRPKETNETLHEDAGSAPSNF